jgi:heterogeneous nuclear ribonucleoprotein A1/A3
VVQFEVHRPSARSEFGVFFEGPVVYRESGATEYSPSGGIEMQQNKLYVGNLAFSATQSDVESAFSSYGEIDEVRLITDRDTGRSRGFAFVTFSTQQDAESALEMNGKTLDGRNLIVNIAKEKTGGGGRGGRRY